MRARLRLVALGAGLATLVLAGAVLAHWLPSDEALAQRAASALSSELGVTVGVAALHWQVLPVPAVVLENVVTQQTQPVRMARLTLYPAWGALWRRRIQFDRITLDGALVPQLSLSALSMPGKSGSSASSPTAAGAPWTAATLPVRRFEFRDVTWISPRDVAVVYAGEADFDEGWRPRTAQLRRPGAQVLTDLDLTRQGQQDSWLLGIHLGGGTVNGEIRLQALDNGRLRLTGKLHPRDVELASGVAAFNRRPIISGKASGETTLSAEGDQAMDLAQALHTQTSLRMQPATLLRFDLDKAIRTAGQDHAGQTRLDSVTGQLDTQNTPGGMVVRFNDIQARSGALSASGKATLANRHIEAAFAVDLVDGVVGVPLTLSGPTDAVKVSVPGAAAVGAAVGTAVLPGVGTVLGARLGAALGKLFGSGQSDKDRSAPVRRAP